MARDLAAIEQEDGELRARRTYKSFSTETHNE